MEYPVLKHLECVGEYRGDGNYEVYFLPIYAIPLKKKEYCKPYATIETKNGTKTVELCGNAKNSKTCNKCVNTARKLFTMNH